LIPELRRSCDRKAIDFGGCRCQAIALARGRFGYRSRLQPLAAAAIAGGAG
jgi:hypothetical protein